MGNKIARKLVITIWVRLDYKNFSGVLQNTPD